MKAGFDFERIELLDHAIRAVGELLVIVRRPPHHQVAIRVKARSLIVKAMCHLVTNDGANAAVVERIVSLWIVERRLQNARRENDLVELRIVISIYCRRRHATFGLFYWPADLAEIASDFKPSRLHSLCVLSDATNLKPCLV